MELSERAKTLLAEVSGRMTASPIETERTLLRPFEAADFPDYFEYAVQKEQQRLSGNAEVNTEAEAREVFAFLSERETHPPLCFAFVYKPENRVVGNFSISVHRFLEQDESLRDRRGVSLSFVLNEKYQRRDLMTELLSRALDCFLGEYGLDYVNCGFFAFNEGSRRLQEKAGMHYHSEHVYPNGNIPVVEMILFREEYEGRKHDCKHL